MSPSPLARRLARYVVEPARNSFGKLALDAFAAQYKWIVPFRERCDRQGFTPANVTDWREIPALPPAAIESGPPDLHAHPELYQSVIEAMFPEACLADLEDGPILRLLPARPQAPHSHLAFICSRAVSTFGASGSEVAYGTGGVDVGKARSWLSARQRDGRPSLIVATAPSLARLLDALHRQDLRFQLPAGTRLLEAGGFGAPGRREIDAVLLRRIEAHLGVPATMVIHLRGMTELTSHFYTRILSGGEADVFVPPHWARVRVLDPESLEEAAPGEAGLICVFDLANLGSAIHVLTDEIGTAAGDGFRLEKG